MIARCENPKRVAFESYGGRGIQVCPEWRADFSAFLRDMGRCPPGCWIERRKNDGNYEPSNCVWASPRTQGRNTRKSIVVHVGNETLSLFEFTCRLGLPWTTLRAHVREHGRDPILAARQLLLRHLAP
jgi:hypothetical protein